MKAADAIKGVPLSYTSPWDVSGLWQSSGMLASSMPEAFSEVANRVLVVGLAVAGAHTWLQGSHRALPIKKCKLHMKNMEKYVLQNRPSRRFLILDLRSCGDPEIARGGEQLIFSHRSMQHHTD